MARVVCLNVGIMTAAQIVAFVATGIFAVLAFFLGRQKYPKLCGFSLVIAFLAFLIGEINAGATFAFQNHLTTEQILCWVVGFFFLSFAFFLVREDHFAYAFMAFLFSVGACFCGLSGVQAILKTHLLTEVTTSLKGYGEKIDKFQATVSDMNDAIVSNQNQVQFQWTNFNDTVSNAEARINAQQKKIGDVEDWVQILYNQKIHDTFSALDSNHVTLYPTNGGVLYALRLSTVPIVNSIEFYTVDPRSGIPQRNWYSKSTLNLICGGLYGYDVDKVSFVIDYIGDPRQTNLYSRMPVLNKEVFFQSHSNTLTWWVQSPPLPDLPQK